MQKKRRHFLLNIYLPKVFGIKIIKDASKMLFTQVDDQPVFYAICIFCTKSVENLVEWYLSEISTKNINAARVI